MTQVDFYLLTASTSEAVEHFMWRLINKIYRKGHRILITFDGQTQCQHWDELLWTKTPTTFIPHQRTDSQLHITSPALTAPQIGINQQATAWLTSEVNRLIEIIPNEANAKAQGRERYRAYQQHQCHLKTHQLSS